MEIKRDSNDAIMMLKEIYVLYYSGFNQTIKCNQRTIRHFREMSKKYFPQTLRKLLQHELKHEIERKGEKTKEKGDIRSRKEEPYTGENGREVLE